MKETKSFGGAGEMQTIYMVNREMGVFATG